MGHGYRAPDNQVIFEPGMTEDEITIRLGSDASEDFRSAVRDADLPSSDVLEFSNAIEWGQVISVTIGPGGALAVLRPVLMAFIENKRERVIKLKHGDIEVETKGCTPRDVDRLLTDLQAASEQRAADWRRIRDLGKSKD